MSRTLAVSRLRHWFLKGGVAILDQGIFSGANFILNLLLARWLDASSYGIFAVAFTVYLFFTGFHNAIILEPISVLGPANYRLNFKEYLHSQFRIHFLITLPLGVLMVLSGWLVSRFSNVALGDTLISIGLVLPVLLLIWLSRRISYLLERPGNALLASTVYLVSLLLGMFLLHTSGYEKLPLWYLLMGLASLLGTLVSQGVVYDQRNFLRVRDLIKEQWRFGRWIVLATVFYFLGSQVQIFVIASILGFDSAGAFRAVQNLTLPVLQMFAAISTLIFPSIASEFGQAGFAAMQRKALQVTAILAGIAFINEVVLVLGKYWFDLVLYDGKYVAYVWLIPMIGIVPLLNAFVSGFSLLLRAIQKPVFYVVDKVLAAAVGYVSAIILVQIWSVTGAVLSLLSVEIATLILYWLLYLKWFKGLQVKNP
jgi:O-antigen/teichoic acid export membrane protein